MANYTYSGTWTVKNKLGAKTHDELQRIESPFVEARAVELALGFGPQGRFDADHLKAIHQHLFQDVYEWAGHTREERVRLSDGTVATEPALQKVDGGAFLDGRQISTALDQVAEKIRDANYLRGLPREAFARDAADLMAEINAVHPFREGNGRTQRTLMQELAKKAGHQLDFTVVSKERMIRASIAANEQSDPAMMRRMFDEITNPERVAALRKATDDLNKHHFNWNDRYIATMQPGHTVTVTMVGIVGDNFMSRTSSDILIGRTADLPSPQPSNDDSFTITPSKDAWLSVVERQQRENSDRRQSLDPANKRAREQHQKPHDAKPKAAKRYKGRYSKGKDKTSDLKKRDNGGRER